MAAQLIDGKAIAAKVRQRIGEKVAELKARGITPGLAVVLVGSDPASKVYVGMKKKIVSSWGCIPQIMNCRNPPAKQSF